MPVGAMPVSCVEGVVPKHVLGFFWDISARDMKDVFVVSKGEVNFVEPAIRLVHAVFCLILADITVWVGRKKVRENNLLGVCAANREGIAHYGPLRLAVQTKNFSEVV